MVTRIIVPCKVHIKVWLFKAMFKFICKCTPLISYLVTHSKHTVTQTRPLPVLLLISTIKREAGQTKSPTENLWWWLKQVFTGKMSFISSQQQHQSNQGTDKNRDNLTGTNLLQRLFLTCRYRLH